MEALLAALFQRKNKDGGLPLMDIVNATKATPVPPPQTNTVDPNQPMTAPPLPNTAPMQPSVRPIQPDSMAGTMMKMYDMYNQNGNTSLGMPNSYDKSSILNRLFSSARGYF